MKQRTRSHDRSPIIIQLFFIVVSALMIVPMLLLLAISFTDEQSLLRNGFNLIPERLSIQGYKVILDAPGQLIQSYGVTIFVTLLGTLLSLVVMSMLAYTISRPDFQYRRGITLYVFFTMMFSGGLVPSYILITQYLHLKNTVWVLIVPMLVAPFLVMIMKGFFASLPFELFDSGKIDGAGEWRIFFQLAVPLSTPVLATMAVMISFSYWNDWWTAFLYVDDKKLVPLQLLLVRILKNIQFVREHAMNAGVNITASSFPSISTRMAMTVLVAGPMMFVFPFFQRYFVKGLTIGSLK